MAEICRLKPSSYALALVYPKRVELNSPSGIAAEMFFNLAEAASDDLA